ncbi:MAG TPA: cytidine deaminase [Anaerolineales bacterium]|nr:cytidine deaminase [Anaerolineales bacterium]
MKFLEVTSQDRLLVQAAIEVITRAYREERHTVGAAVLCGSGTIYTGVNVDSCGYGPCAEPIAIGTAVSQGEREFVTIVAVGGWNTRYPVLPPCGNCRQLLWDYAPKATVLLGKNDTLIKVSIADLLPQAYRNFYDD